MRIVDKIFEKNFDHSYHIIKVNDICDLMKNAFSNIFFSGNLVVKSRPNHVPRFLFSNSMLLILIVQQFQYRNDISFESELTLYEQNHKNLERRNSSGSNLK